MASITQISTSTDLTSVSGTKITGSGTTTPTDTSSSDNAEALKNQFLSILLTQMQHQNPLDPMDTKEFTGQLTQFSSLEQQIDTNSKLDSLLGSLNQNSLSAAFGYIGQYVDLDSETTSMQDGSANWTYAMPEDAASVTIKITDEAGNIVYKGTMQNDAGGGAMSAGTYKFGITNDDLTTAMEDGAVLKMSITANNEAGTAITADIHTTVKVDSVQSDADGTYLQAGGILFEIADVKKIVSPPTSTSVVANTTDTNTDTTTS
jgi:flagellar basal-body rod modification protein FlgD